MEATKDGKDDEHKVTQEQWFLVRQLYVPAAEI